MKDKKVIIIEQVFSQTTEMESLLLTREIFWQHILLTFETYGMNKIEITSTLAVTSHIQILSSITQFIYLQCHIVHAASIICPITGLSQHQSGHVRLYESDYTFIQIFLYSCTCLFIHSFFCLLSFSSGFVCFLLVCFFVCFIV